jgi:putative ATPase
VHQQFLPDELQQMRIWHPQSNPQEVRLKEQMQMLWGDRFNE